MARYFIELAYNGSSYHGWQIQENALSVQQVIEETFSKIARQKIELLGCGRTDTGVHASQFFAHFDWHDDQLDIPFWVRKLNMVLPPSISIFAIHRVKDDAHARFDAIFRTYRYRVHLHKDAFLENSSLHLYPVPDFKAMNKAAELLFNYRDFECFSKSNTQTLTNNCRIMEAKWLESNENEWYFEISADRFLRNMVRAIVGTLLELGNGKTDEAELKKILESKNRSNAGTSVPAHALYLYRIAYPKNIFLP